MNVRRENSLKELRVSDETETNAERATFEVREERALQSPGGNPSPEKMIPVIAEMQQRQAALESQMLEQREQIRDLQTSREQMENQLRFFRAEIEETMVLALRPLAGVVPSVQHMEAQLKKLHGHVEAMLRYSETVEGRMGAVEQRIDRLSNVPGIRHLRGLKRRLFS